MTENKQFYFRETTVYRRTSEKRFAGDELLTELMLISNAMVSFFSASSASCSGTRGTSFLQTPDLRQCRGLKSGNLVQNYFDEEREGKRLSSCVRFESISRKAGPT